MGSKPKTKTGSSTKTSIKTKLIAIMVAVAAVPLLIAILVSYSTSTNKAKSDALEILAAQAQAVELEYSNVINQNIKALQTFANAHSTQDFVENYGKPGAQYSPDDILAEIDKVNENMKDGNKSMNMCAVTGDQILRADRGDFVSIADRDYFQECVSSGKPVVSNIITAKSTGNRVTNIIVPIFNEQGVVIGTVHRSYNLDNLHNFLANHVSDGFILDRNGIMAAHAQFEISGTDDPIDMGGSEFVTSTESGGMLVAAYDGVPTYTSWVREPISGYIVTVSQQETAIMAEAKKAAMIVVIIGVVLVILAIIISLLMANSFTRPISAVNETLAALADGRFVRVEKYDQRTDEFGAISKAANSVIDTLSDIVSNIKSSANSVGDSSDELSNMADQISHTAEDVSNAVQEIALGATNQADEISSASTNVGLIGDAVNDVQNSTDELSTLAGKMKEASEISSKSLVSLQDSSAEMTEKIDDISRTIEATRNAVNNINEKVEGITSIATQTNLLSLNASIEAARAGEAGRGFAVVAEEIGKLADDSKQMATDISIEMDALLEQSKAAVAAAEAVKEGNNAQQVALGETLEAVNGLLEDIGSTAGGVKLILQGAETCETSKDAVVGTMSALSAISEENAASSEQTGASMQELSATVTTLAASANDLKKIAEQLNDKIRFFKD